MAKPIRGTNQDDLLHDRGIARVLSGGNGDDTYIIDHNATTVEEKKNGGVDTVEASVSFALHHWIEALILTGSVDIDGHGNAQDNLLVGNDGDNTLYGLYGDDTLKGGKGSDIIVGGEGDDTSVFSGTLSDYAIQLNEDGLLQVQLVVEPDTDRDLLDGVEWLAFDDTVVAVADLFPPDLPAPVANADIASVPEDQSLLIDVLQNDEGEGLTLASVSNAEWGEVFLDGDKVRYVPSADWNGTDRFTYTIKDAAGVQSTGTVEVQVVAQDDAPVANSDSIEATGGTFEITAEQLLGNDFDPDGDTLSILAVDQTTANGGSIQLNDAGHLVYEAPSQYQGGDPLETDSFSYVVTDGAGGEATAMVEITFTPIDDPSPGSRGDADVPSYVLDALLRDGAGETAFRWNADQPLGEAVTISFSFLEAIPDYYGETAPERTGFEPLSDVQQTAVLDILSQIESFTNISFVEATDGVGDLAFGTAALPSGAGWAYSPTGGQLSGDVWLSNLVDANANPEPGTDGFRTFLHEIGHALGLQHPHDTEHLSLEELHGEFTVMSYMAPDDSLGVEPSGYMIYDIAALQHLYGANQTGSSGDDLYNVSALDNTFETIWDSGGWDVIDASEATRSVTIDLNQASHSSVGTVYGWYEVNDNLGVAFGSIIEEAIGGHGDDILIGNSEDNDLTGGDGADIFVAAEDWGIDTIYDFENGADRIDLSGTGASYSDLMIRDENGHVIISYLENEITLLNNSSESLDEADFLL